MNPFKKPKDHKVSPTAKVIIEMLARPDDWTFEEHYAVHFGGARIWIGNIGPAYAFSREVTIPGFGKVVARSGRGIETTPDQIAIDLAVTAAREAKTANAMTKYLADAGLNRERLARERQEQARRLDFDAGTYAKAAEDATRRAADLRKEDQ